MTCPSRSGHAGARLRLRSLLLTLSALLALAAAGLAEDAPRDSARAEEDAARVRLLLDEVLVTATRSPMSRFGVPYTAHVLRLRPEQRHLFRGPTEALRAVPGAMAQKTAPGQGSPFCRGFTGFRNLYLVDGVRLNNSVFREGPNQYWSTVDLLAQDRLEVVMGPGSVLYGSDAVGATIQAIGSSEARWPAGPPLRGSLDLRGASAERSHGARGEIDLGGPRESRLHVGWTGRRFGDLQGGREIGRQPGTGYDESGGDAKLVWPLGRAGDLVVAHQRFRQENVPRTHSTRDARPFAGTTLGTDLLRVLDQSRDLTRVRLQARAGTGFVRAWSVGASWQETGEEEHRVTAAGAIRDQGFDVGTAGVTAQLETRDGRFGSWTSGFEAYRDRVDSRSNTNPIQGPVADDASYDLTGTYLQGRFEPRAGWTVLAGGRFTTAGAEAKRVRDPATGATVAIEDAWQALTGSVRLGWQPVDRLSAFAGVSQGFRAPNLSDLTRFDNARTSEFEIPAFSLEPEHFVSYETGVKARSSRGALALAFFHTDVADLIVRRPTGRMVGSNFEVTRTNDGHGYVHGVEAEAHAEIARGWTVGASGTWQEGWLTQFPTSAPVLVREPFSRVMPLSGAARLRWTSVSGSRWVETEAAGATRQHRLSTADRLDTQRIPPGGTPAWAALAVRGGLALMDDRYVVTLAVENLLDEDYRVHGSGTNEPGRSGVLGVRVAF